MKAGPLILLAVACVCFAFALADQFSSGDVYARGSSLRTDREGASVWFEALEKTGVRSERNYAPLDTLKASGSAVLLFGISPSSLEEKETVDGFERLAKSGARVSLLLDGSPLKEVNIRAWGLEIHAAGKDDDDDDEDTSRWRSEFVVAQDWRVIRAQLNKPVVVERTFGKGTIAIAAATWPFLNQNLRENRDIALLNWAVAGSNRVIFDESHLGSARGGTIVGLMRRFRLQGVAAALLLASLLFVWRSSVPYPPVAEPGEKSADGTAASDALRNLLESRVAPGGLVGVCAKEWSRDFSRRVGREKAEAVLQIADEKIPETERWEKIRSVLHPKRTL